MKSPPKKDSVQRPDIYTQFSPGSPPLLCTHPKDCFFPSHPFRRRARIGPGPPTSPSAHAACRLSIRRRESQWADTRPGRLGPSRGSLSLCVRMAAVCCILVAQRRPRGFPHLFNQPFQTLGFISARNGFNRVFQRPLFHPPLCAPIPSHL